MLAKELTAKYGNGYSRNNLYRFISFYKSFPNIFHAVSGSLEIADFYASLIPTQPLRLSWTHYSIILQELTAESRTWYENEAANEMWSTRTLQRNVSSQYIQAYF